MKVEEEEEEYENSITKLIDIVEEEEVNKWKFNHKVNQHSRRIRRRRAPGSCWRNSLILLLIFFQEEHLVMKIQSQRRRRS